VESEVASGGRQHAGITFSTIVEDWVVCGYVRWNFGAPSVRYWIRSTRLHESSLTRVFTILP
jgi:hypothetical protein